jgi:hypothetical protein
VCGVDRGGPWMSSAGAELDLDTAFQYDYPARLRLGVAAPLSGKEETGARVISAYFTIGSSF